MAEGAAQKAYEPSAVDVRRVRTVAMALAGLVALCLVSAFGLLTLWHGGEIREISQPQIDVRQLPPEPRLEPDPNTVMRNYLREQQSALQSYRWVDRSQGVVQIPIDRAMEQLAARESQSGAQP